MDYCILNYWPLIKNLIVLRHLYNLLQYLLSKEVFY
jgi:hypothetical protein